MADRYLSQQIVDSKIEMALVFCASMLIATKYEEIYPPTGKELLQTMLKSKDRAAMYTHEDLLQMEFNILKEIEYSVQETSALAFVQRYAIVGQTPEKIQNMAKYLLDLSLLDSKMNQHLPSVLAAASLYTAMRVDLVAKD